MKWKNFLDRVQSYPVIRTEDLLIGEHDKATLEVQLSRWVKKGYLKRLKRGVYILDHAFRKVHPFDPFVASVLTSPSYISLHKALEVYDLIPEGVPVFTCVTTKRPFRYKTALGTFQYRHIHPELFWGYHSVSDKGQTGFFAKPEKALLDLFYFTSTTIDDDYLQELRLQNLDTLDREAIMQMARRFDRPKMQQAAAVFMRFMDHSLSEERTL